MTDEQIKYMRDRFLSWVLPETLNPDGGISFKRSTWLDDDGVRHNHVMPIGTNFLDAVQAEEMVRYMIDGLPAHSDAERVKRLEEALQGILDIGKRDMSNPKYDNYFYEARAALADKREEPHG